MTIEQASAVFSTLLVMVSFLLACSYRYGGASHD